MSEFNVNPPPLGHATKFLYGVGSFAYGIKDIAFRSYLLIYYNQVIGIPAHIVSFAILVALLFDAVSDPIVGQISDNLRTRFGRRHLLMYLSAIPSAVIFYFLWRPPEGLTDPQMFLFLVGMSCALRTFITLYEIPSSALAPELVTDYNERTSIAAYRYLFGYLGYFGMSFLTLFFFLRPTEEYPIGQLNPDGYLTFGLVGAVIMFITVIMSTAGTHHRIPYLAEPKKREKSDDSFFRHIITCFSHKGFLSILAFGTLKYTALGLAGALTLYFGTYFWGLTAKQLALLTIVGVMSACLAFVLAPTLSRKFGKRNSAFILAAIGVTVGVLPFVLRLNGLFPENGSPALLPTLLLFEMVYFTSGAASATLVHAMIGDVTDESSLKTGKRSEGLFYAANSLMQKSVSGLGVFIGGIADPATLDPSIINKLAMIYVPTIMALYLGGASFLYFYKIDRAQQLANLSKIQNQSAARSEKS